MSGRKTVASFYRCHRIRHFLEAMKRPNPLTVRLTENEKQTLSRVAKELGSTRNNFVRTACFTFVRDIQDANLIGAKQ